MKRIKISESELDSLDTLASKARMEWFITDYGCRPVLVGDAVKPCKRVRKTLPLDVIKDLHDGAMIPENTLRMSKEDVANCNAVFDRANIK